MAGIDKIYGTQEQYQELRSWLSDNNRALLKYLYPETGYPNTNRAISNFPGWADYWLFKNCPLEFVVKGIELQYNGPPPKGV